MTDPESADYLLKGGTLEPSSLDSDGFVHCSTAVQVVGSTERHFDAGAELVLIELDPDRLESELRWPEVYPGEPYPHLHGPLTAGSVVAIHSWTATDRQCWPG
ncbi:MAG: DUF952 domain-containing protein [Actinomycetia bacterium]|nr:DUF952 domain-containing protein [Actinomycetes bacterium]